MFGKENASPIRPTTSSSAPLLSKPQLAGSPTSPKRPRIFHTTSIFNDRFLDLPPLPDTWTTQHDRAICLLDSRNYSHAAIVAKLRRVFPELRGTLTPLMIDKRLRILDQNVELDYWRISNRAISTPPRPERDFGMQTSDTTPTKAAKGGRFMGSLLEKYLNPRKLTQELGVGRKSCVERF